MVASAVVTVALFGYMSASALRSPADAPPTVTVARETPEAGGVAVLVRLDNPASRGYRSVIVEVGCGDPPPILEFLHVPAGSRRDATAMCPGGSAGIDARIVSLMTA